MNVIVIVSDSFRRDHLGCYGNEWISTPDLDAFADKWLTCAGTPETWAGSD